MSDNNITKLVVLVVPDGQLITLKGRVAWAVFQLHKAGVDGCTPIDNPGPRWSDYIRKARLAGVPVQTITENHHGSYPGHHGRYRLSGPVEIIEIETGGARP